MLRSCDLVFNDVVQGTTPVTTSPRWDQPMSVADSWHLLVVASQASGTTPTVTVDLELSADGVNWSDFGPILEHDLDTANKTVLSTDPIEGLLGYMRLKITLGGTDPSARLQLWHAGRDFSL